MVYHNKQHHFNKPHHKKTGKWDNHKNKNKNKNKNG